MGKRLKALFMGRKDEARTDKTVFSFMLASGIVALGAAFVLTLEKFHLYENPDAVLSCSINIVLNCSTVMQSWQSHVFGFPNMIIGLMAYAVVVTVAVVGLTGAKLPRWFWIAANVGFMLGLIFSYWLFFNSVYAIQVLCPWCLLVTASTTVIFSTMLHYNLKHNVFEVSKHTNERVQRFLTAGYHQMIVLAWLALMVALVFIQFGDALFA